jgi:hypothetical protein
MMANSTQHSINELYKTQVVFVLLGLVMPRQWTSMTLTPTPAVPEAFILWSIFLRRWRQQTNRRALARFFDLTVMTIISQPSQTFAMSKA